MPSSRQMHNKHWRHGMMIPGANSLIPEMVVAATLLLVLPGILLGHCDTMDGPVVADARKALETGKVSPVLKWVLPEDEQEIKDAFKKAAAVRKTGGEAADLAAKQSFAHYLVPNLVWNQKKTKTRSEMNWRTYVKIHPSNPAFNFKCIVASNLLQQRTAG